MDHKIETVQDLLKLNQVSTLTPQEQLLTKKVGDIVYSIVKENDPRTTFYITLVLLQHLRSYHTAIVNQKMEEGDYDHVAGWVSDESRLTSALMIIKDMNVF